MSNTAWIMIGIIGLALAASIGVFLYQKSKVDAERLNNEKLGILTGSLQTSVQLGQAKAGLGGFISDFLGSSGGNTLISAWTAPKTPKTVTTPKVVK